MYTITSPETPRDKLGRKAKKALRAVQRGGGTLGQQKLARAFLHKGLRITTPYVGFNESGEYLVVTKRSRPGYPPISKTLELLISELMSYGYQLTYTETDDYDRPDCFTFCLPLMAKCIKGHYMPYESVSHWRSRCTECNEELWTGPVQHDRVLLWQGHEYEAGDDSTVPAPPVMTIFYDFNGTECPKPPVPPKGRRRRRYMKAQKRWSDIQWDIYSTWLGEDIARSHMEDLGKEYDATTCIDPKDAIQGPVQFTAEMEAAFTKMVEAHAASPFGYQTLNDTVLMFLYEQAYRLEEGENLTFADANDMAIRRSDNYPDNPDVVNAANIWERAIRLGWRQLKRQLSQ